MESNSLFLWCRPVFNFLLQLHCVCTGIALVKNTPQVKPRHSNGSTPMSRVVLPDDLIAEVLSFLTVKSLMRLRCLSKYWNTLISNPTFVKIHLKRSPRNSRLILFSSNEKDCSVVPFPVCGLLESRLITSDDPYYRLKDKDCSYVVGSCNGLLCLLGYSSTIDYGDISLCLWNPATGMMSEKIGVFRDHGKFTFRRFGKFLCRSFKFVFGYDNSTNTYKIVAFRPPINQVRVFSFGDNDWRYIQCFPVVPLDLVVPIPLPYSHPGGMDHGVYLSGTINWLAIRNKTSYYYWKDITVEQFVIISLDMGMETYTQLALPQCSDEVPPVQPTIAMLMDCLCFSHDFKGTHFIIWKMTEFGVEESWTQFLKISYMNLFQIDYGISAVLGFHSQLFLFPLCLSENGDTLILASNQVHQAILYNWRDNRVAQTRSTCEIWWFYVKDYVESLVSTY